MRPTHLASYLGLLHHAESELASAYVEVGRQHADESDVHLMLHDFAGESARHAGALQPFADRYGEEAADEPERLHSELFGGPRSGGMALLRDLHDLYLMVQECDISWTLIGQAAQGVHDEELLAVVRACEAETADQAAWLRTRMKQAAPQSLIVAR
jgi:hypothetical protein